MRRIHLAYSIFFFFIPTIVSAQLSDLAKIEYTILPKGNSSIDYHRFRALFNYPVKLKENSFFLFGLDYSNIDLSFDKSVVAFETKNIEEFQLLDLNIGYTIKMNQDWRFGAKFAPGISSNLTANNLSLDDIVLSGLFVFIKDKREDRTLVKPYRLILGVSYSGNQGIGFPLPFISYYKKFHPNWSFNIGIPKSNLQYHLSEKSRFKLFAQLDGFNGNIQKGLIVNETKRAEKINMAAVVGGLRYEYKFTKHLEFFSNIGYILRSTAELQDKGNNNILALDNDNLFYLRTGIRLKL